MNLSDLLKRVSEEDKDKMFIFRDTDGSWSNVNFHIREHEISITLDDNTIFSDDKDFTKENDNMNIEQILKNVEELEDEFYGKEEDDFEGGVFEENYECAEWARDNVSDLFSTIRDLANELKRLKQ